jgi:hypothetical protein
VSGCRKYPADLADPHLVRTFAALTAGSYAMGRRPVLIRFGLVRYSQLRDDALRGMEQHGGGVASVA